MGWIHVGHSPQISWHLPALWLLAPICNAALSESAGGHAWFSWFNNSSRAPSCRTIKYTVIPNVTCQLCSVLGMELIWDTYKDDYLKGTARAKGGKGVTRCVDRKAAIPGNYLGWLQQDRTSWPHVAMKRQTVVCYCMYHTIHSMATKRSSWHWCMLWSCLCSP